MVESVGWLKPPSSSSLPAPSTATSSGTWIFPLRHTWRSCRAKPSHAQKPAATSAGGFDQERDAVALGGDGTTHGQSAKDLNFQATQSPTALFFLKLTQPHPNHMKSTRSLLFILLLTTIGGLHAEEGWRCLFNGKDLAGWKPNA
jgi:hypothetical protein